MNDAKTTGTECEEEVEEEVEEELSPQVIAYAPCVREGLGIDPDYRTGIWEAAVLQEAGKLTPRPGRPSREGPGLIARRSTNPLARLYIGIWHAETMYLPLPICQARTPEDRTRINREIAYVLTLDLAQEAGIITGWTVCWKAGPFPKRPSTVRLLTAWGPKTRERCLGDLARQLSRDRNRRKQWEKEIFG